MLNTNRISLYQDLEQFNHSNSPSYLIEKEKVLVPVNIWRLFDHQVVCQDQQGVLDRTELINQISKTCNIQLNGTISIDLHPPIDFQVRSPSTSKYAQLWQTTKKCSLYENETVAIVIPYRDRENNLRNLLYNLVPFLNRQSIVNYKIFIVEQQALGAFNKARLNNFAFHHLMKTYKPTCVIFHDVDLIPENNQNLYTCLTSADHPIHMSANVRSQLEGKYTKIYSFLVGGVLAIRPKSFQFLNGYSNQYFNWGGEDDDMGLRFLAKDTCVQRPTTGFYYAASHSSQTRNPKRVRLLFDAVIRQDTDGLSNIDRLAKIANVYEYPLVTWMTVEWIDSRLSVS
ncbi:unnamed protein product [Adineta ricciae]|uniref:Beta-1,4-galactosyltransferase n=1 Tax=Adineta ricciae TaxID=249248 RepID=A0A814XEK1_ADIRI|nr:unnamed protein product [Adineta ricciae]CAF1299187.1 unnamed protein product [Adineta ricciae]